MAIVPALPGNWLDTGDNAWQLTAATLVGLQSVPGLVVLYGLLTSNRMPAMTALFLVSTVATSVSGFGFKRDQILPSQRGETWNDTEAINRHREMTPSQRVALAIQISRITLRIAYAGRVASERPDVRA